MVVGVSSVWKKYKGLDDLITLSRNPQFVVILVGLKPSQVQKLSGEEYRDCNMVPICRTQDQCELAMIYSLADVFVNPTYADMFPTVNLEALACGTPVITYKTGGSPEAVDENTGMVIPQGNVDALAKAIIQLKDKPLSREACRQRAVEVFDKDRCFEEYVRLYKQLID